MKFKLQQPFIISILSIVLLGATGCSDGNSDSATADTGKASPNGSLPSLQDLPDCGKIASIIRGVVAEMIPAATNEESHFDNGNAYGVQCSWVTHDATSTNPFEQIKTGALSISLTVDRVPMDENALRSMGMVYDDPRVKALGGFIVGKADPEKQLGMIGPMVVIGAVSVNSSAGGALLQNVEKMQALTNDKAIEYSVALYQSLQLK